MTLSTPNGFSALRHRNFACYLSARLLGTIAVQMQNVAVGWQVYAITGNALDLGFIGLAQFAPFFLLVLVAGQAADQFNRRAIIMVCHAVELICALSLLLFTLSGYRSLWPVFASLVLFGAARAFRMPTSQAILMNLVPLQNFGNAVAISSSTFHVAVIVGPTVGGLLYLFGPAVVYGAAALLFLLALLLMSLARIAQPAVRKETPNWNTLLEGLRFVGSRPVVLGAISLDLFAVLFGGATALLPAYASDILQVGPQGLGLLRTAPGVGAAVISILLAFKPMSSRVGYWMFGGVGLFGVATIVFGLSERFWLSLLALFVLGASDMISVYVRHLLVQLETPDAIRGRVSAVNAVFIGASNELGEFESGVTAAWFGLVPAVVLGGVATLVVTAAWMWRFPALRRTDRFPGSV
ncbi:MAG: MFS transporter [Candidatus Competibacteraceae bacterium]|nr:MFS transporter [Candidatus Competibacteraceae bacterium]MBK8899161.1 MFS transporter [Candidatus Competibacteraceae bacterium]MBK9952162.1 MFS transporter [Candidatus Competibacteraceae bacterium]